MYLYCNCICKCIVFVNVFVWVLYLQLHLYCNCICICIVFAIVFVCVSGVKRSGVWSEVKWRSYVEYLYYHWFQLCNSYVGYCIVCCLIVLYTCFIVSCVLVLGSVIHFMIVYSLHLLLVLCVFCIFHCLVHCFSSCIFVPFYLCTVLRTAATGWNPSCS
jgi:hypothetical protein